MRFILDRPHKHHRLHKLRIVMPRCFAETPLVPLSLTMTLRVRTLDAWRRQFDTKEMEKFLQKKPIALFVFLPKILRCPIPQQQQQQQQQQQKCVRFFNRD